MIKPVINFLLLSILLLTAWNIHSQISYGGEPYSFRHSLKTSMEEIHLSPISVDKYIQDDLERDRNKDFYRTGIGIQVSLNSNIHGTWTEVADGRLWRLKIASRGAVALGINFDDFWIPEGGELFLYNEDTSKILGAFTYLSNPSSGIFSTEPVHGSSIIIEYFEPGYAFSESRLSINTVAYMYRGFDSMGLNLKNYNSSESCQVDIACSEANNWRDPLRSVAKIVVKDGDMYGFCTGSLVNNTQDNCLPYFLTADHCGETSTFDDFQSWIFIFNFERIACNNYSEQEPSYISVSGAKRLAHGGNYVGNKSDFLLVQLSTYLPTAANVYFNAWRNTNLASSAGVCIHHPSGDVKKVSTYTNTISNYYSTHWNVGWNSTVNGWGVTEGGSSGSPLFNSAKEVIGTLTGGLSACTNGGAGAGTGPTQKDIYGKFSYHWLSNGSLPINRLKNWLDPMNTNPTSMTGRNNNCNEYPVIADFYVTDSIIPLGTTVKFVNLSLYHSDYGCSYFWEFEGTAQTSTSVINSPTRTFNANGIYPVKLTSTSNGSISQKIIHMYVGNIGIDESEASIFQVYPNPAGNELNLALNRSYESSTLIEIFDMMGKLVYTEELQAGAIHQTINLTSLSTGMYQILVRNMQGSFTRKLSVVK